MRDTPEIRQWVSDKVEKYYKQIGVNRLPKVFYTNSDVPRVLHTDDRVKNYKKYAAVSARSMGKKPHVILINLPYHKSFRELEDTIAHEMMHIRFAHLNHNDTEKQGSHEDFFIRLGMILQGKHYPKAVRKKRLNS